MSLADLGRRAVACKRWRWMPGMRWNAGDDCGRLDDYQPEYMAHPADAAPDLSDPATLGCLLALVREAWPEEWHQFMVPIFGGMDHWYMGCMMQGTSKIIMPTRLMQNGLPDTIPPKRTEAEALVAALEAAP